MPHNTVSIKNFDLTSVIEYVRAQFHLFWLGVKSHQLSTLIIWRLSEFTDEDALAYIIFGANRHLSKNTDDPM
jgi:hypothetical protein